MSQKQHVDFYKKVLLRKKLLKAFESETRTVYVPYCGDLDLALELYTDYTIAAMDFDENRVFTAESRLSQFKPGSKVSQGDVEASWPWGNPSIDIADFDAYNNPYKAFKLFWDNTIKPSKLLLFFTDGQRQGIIRSGVLEGRKIETLAERRKLLNMYLKIHALPKVKSIIGKEWEIVKKSFYLRGWMLYWGVILVRN